MSGESYYLENLEIALYVVGSVAVVLLVGGCIYQYCCYNNVSTTGDNEDFI